MVDQKDFYRSAELLIKRHGADAEKLALDRVKKFMAKEDVAAASVWLMIAQAISFLKMQGHSGTIH